MDGAHADLSLCILACPRSFTIATLGQQHSQRTRVNHPVGIASVSSHALHSCLVLRAVHADNFADDSCACQGRAMPFRA
eukprot:50283-Eustigmatos_ZCMA.PRE.1